MIEAQEADAVINLMRQAAECNASSPLQHGHLVELPARGSILVTGDLHGNLNNMQRVIQLANLKMHQDRHLVLQELVHELNAIEDICRSYRLVEMAAQLTVSFPSRVHLLLGNHEFAELMEIEIGKNGRGLNTAFSDGLRQCYGNRWAEVKEAYRKFWHSCPLAVRTDSRLFVSHSTPRLEKLNNLDLEYLRTASNEELFRRDGPIFSMLWDRDYSEQAAECFAARVDAEILLVGHTAVESGVRTPNTRHIILDSKDFEARYALLPLALPLSQRQALAYVQKLHR